jgi:transposase
VLLALYCGHVKTEAVSSRTLTPGSPGVGRAIAGWPTAGSNHAEGVGASRSGRREACQSRGSRLGLAAKTVREIRDRYRQSGLERALYDKPRPGAVPRLDASQRQRVIAMVCSDPPEGRARWTVRLLTEEAIRRKLVSSVGRETIRVLLQNHDLQSWRGKNVVYRRSQ